MVDQADAARAIADRWEAMTGRLRAALERRTHHVDPPMVRRVAAQSEAYRRGEAVALTTRADAEAYVAARMPATVAAIGAAMRATAGAVAGFAPASQLDLGSGSGAALWSARAVWPSVATALAVDRATAALDLGVELAADMGTPEPVALEVRRGDLRTAPLGSAELVTMTYVLGELLPEERTDVVERAWEATTGVLVVVEPGTPAGFARIRGARTALVAAGATVAAPCPHDRTCPMADPDWCHFAARLARSRLHRRVKGAEVPWEDEPFSYVAASRIPGERGSRVLTRPSVRAGAIGLRLCTSGGIVQRTVSRREGAAYREARHAAWGSRFRDGT